ncbi:MAG: methionyl-tRNA formyltransferase [Psychromonas sp.]|nr:methionyl-tRNA formyltransferase [Psychromonas sp.]
MKNLNIVFAGTPDFAAKHLNALIDSEHNIVAVYTQPDRPAGRGKKLTASAVKNLALTHDLPVYQPIDFKKASIINQLAALNSDIMIVVAYGLILPKSVLQTPLLGCLNVHGSLLPRWRGAAPIQRSIWAGDTQTGITIMQMDEGLDTGDILCKTICQISADETSASLYEKLAEKSPETLIETINLLAEGKLTPQMQNNNLANYAKKLSKEEALINWDNDAQMIERCIRAFNPWPISYFKVQNNSIKVHKASYINEQSDKPAGCILKADKNGIQVNTGNGIINLQVIQLSGKKAMPVKDILNARKSLFAINTQFDLSANLSGN